MSGSKSAIAADSLIVKQLVNRISRQQGKHGTYFGEGLFPSFRGYYFNSGSLKNDDNSFFTGLIVFTLRSLQPALDKGSQRVCDSVIKKALPAFFRFKNPKGRNVYSFWQTSPVKYFPNSGALSLFRANALPDDADCTVIALMAQSASPSVAAGVHQYMQAFANNQKHRVKSTFASYKSLPAYSTWLGHKVPVDFDICVLANILSFVHAYNLTYTAADSASLQFICRSVQNRQYLSDAIYISPYYNKPSIILYHLARLMMSKQVPELEQYRGRLISDAIKCYATADTFMDKVILSSALLKWNVVLPAFEEELNPQYFLQQHEHVFFVANLASMLPNPFNRPLARSNIGRFDYYCPAYNDVLMLENLVLRGKLLP